MQDRPHVLVVADRFQVVFWATTGDTTSPPKPASTTYTHPLDSHPLGPVTDASPNPWAVDCEALLDVLGEEAHTYGC